VRNAGTITNRHDIGIDGGDVLRSRVAFAGQYRLVDLDPVGDYQSAIGRNPVAGFEQHEVSRNQLCGRHHDRGGIAADASVINQHPPQCVQGSFRPVLLHEPDHCVDQHNHQHHQRRLQLARDHERHQRSADQDQDQQISELPEKAAPAGHAHCLCQHVATDKCPTLSHVGVG